MPCSCRTAPLVALLGLLAGAVAPAAIAAARVESSYDATYHFQDWTRFELLPPPAISAQAADRTDEEREAARKLVTDALLRELEGAGFTPSGDERPQFRIRWYIGSATDFSGEPRGAFESAWLREDDHRTATHRPLDPEILDPRTSNVLTLEVLEPGADHRVWRGSVTDRVPEGQLRSKLPGAVTQLVGRFVADRAARARKARQ